MVRCTRMTTKTQSQTPTLQTFGVVALLAGVWLVAAILRPDSTFHLGPVLLPLVPLLTTPRDSDPRQAILFGIATGFVVLLILGIGGRLDGPAFEPFPSVAAESVFALLASGAVGLVFARATR